VKEGVVVAERVGAAALKVGDPVAAVVQTEEIRRGDGTLLDVKEVETVPLKVTTVLEHSFECALVQPEDAAKLEPDLPIRAQKPPKAVPTAPDASRQVRPAAKSTAVKAAAKPAAKSTAGKAAPAKPGVSKAAPAKPKPAPKKPKAGKAPAKR